MLRVSGSVASPHSPLMACAHPRDAVGVVGVSSMHEGGNTKDGRERDAVYLLFPLQTYQRSPADDKFGGYQTAG